MSAQDFAILAHVVLFCYWLGGDVGVFYSSKFVINPELSRDTRLIAAKIMIGCDLVPRMCMSLMLTTAGILTAFAGLEHPLWQMIGIILLGPVWLTMVLVLHFSHNAPFIPALTKIDFYFRWLVIVGGIASCLYALNVGRLDGAPWIAAKLMLFYFTVFCGLMIRIQMKGFGSSYGKLVADNYNDADNQIMIKSLKRATPWVYAIWATLLLEASIGISKPGSPDHNFTIQHAAAITTVEENIDGTSNI
jgi:hypothetical protein